MWSRSFCPLSSGLHSDVSGSCWCLYRSLKLSEWRGSIHCSRSEAKQKLPQIRSARQFHSKEMDPLTWIKVRPLKRGRAPDMVSSSSRWWCWCCHRRVMEEDSGSCVHGCSNDWSTITEGEVVVRWSFYFNQSVVWLAVQKWLLGCRENNVAKGEKLKLVLKLLSLI